MAKIDTPKCAIPLASMPGGHTDLSQGLGGGSGFNRRLVRILVDRVRGRAHAGAEHGLRHSRSLTQGRTAGMIALLGVLFGSLGYLVPAALGVGVLLSTLPHVCDVLRIAGALYLGYLAWKAVHSAGWANVDSRPLAREGHAKLFRSGVLVGLLNPATALLYLTVFPKFVDPARGGALGQTLVLGVAYIVINGSVKAIVVVLAGALAQFATPQPSVRSGRRAGRLALRWPFSR